MPFIAWKDTEKIRHIKVYAMIWWGLVIPVQHTTPKAGNGLHLSLPRCYLKDYIGDHVLLNETERLRYIKNA